MENEIDISKMDKAHILAALYNNATPQGMGYLQFTSTPMSIKEARKILDSGQTYFDYIGGRVMKIDLKSDLLFTGLYNRDNWENTVEQVLSEVPGYPN